MVPRCTTHLSPVSKTAFALLESSLLLRRNPEFKSAEFSQHMPKAPFVDTRSMDLTPLFIVGTAFLDMQI